jgi:hypothetical protein
MGTTKIRGDVDGDGAFWRLMTLPVEDRMQLYSGERWPGYRWFRSENVVALEHFKKPRQPGQRAGRYGWVDGR